MSPIILAILAVSAWPIALVRSLIFGFSVTGIFGKLPSRNLRPQDVQKIVEVGNRTA